MAANWKNRTVFTGDNLDVLRGMNSESVDLVYLDPPFNSNRSYSAPIGSEAAGAAFKDAWSLSDVDEAWHGEIADREPALYAVIDAAGLAHGKGMKAYLIMMVVRLLELRRLLKQNGSIYLHCDPTASHYLKMAMDCVFGKENFRNEIVWHYYNKYSAGKSAFGRNYDQILFYAASKKTAFTPLREKRDAPVRQLVRQNVGGVLKNKRDSEGNLMYRVVDDKKVDAVWRIPCVQPASKDYTGYPTQKPLALLERIIKASSDEGGVVLDPFCGCATALVASERLGRQWVGVDLSPLAVSLVKQRLQRHAGVDSGGSGQAGLLGRVTALRRPLRRTDMGDLPDYRTHKHTLYGRQEGVCGGCSVHFPFRNLTVDHVVPQSKGGSDHLENLQLLCGACNSSKGAGTQAELKARLRRQGVVE